MTGRLQARANGDLMNVDELRVFMSRKALCCNGTFIMRIDWCIDGVWWYMKGIIMHREVSRRPREVKGEGKSPWSPGNLGTLVD